MTWLLLVEDQPEVGRAVSRWLARRLDTEVAVAASLGGMHDVLDGRPDPPEAVLLDHRLGAESGVDALVELRARGLEAPVAFLTSDTPAMVGRALTGRGVSEHPPTLAKTEAGVDRAVDWIRQHRTARR